MVSPVAAVRSHVCETATAWRAAGPTTCTRMMSRCRWTTPRVRHWLPRRGERRSGTPARPSRPAALRPIAQVGCSQGARRWRVRRSATVSGALLTARSHRCHTHQRPDPTLGRVPSALTPTAEQTPSSATVLDLLPGVSLTTRRRRHPGQGLLDVIAAPGPGRLATDPAFDSMTHYGILSLEVRVPLGVSKSPGRCKADPAATCHSTSSELACCGRCSSARLAAARAGEGRRRRHRFEGLRSQRNDSCSPSSSRRRHSSGLSLDWLSWQAMAARCLVRST